MSNDQDLQQRIEALDAMVSREGAFLRLDLDSEGGALYGNRAGYLRFAIELLRAAIGPPETGGTHPCLAVDTVYLLTADSDYLDYTPYLVEIAPQRPPDASELKGSPWVGVAILGAIVFVFALAGIGIAAILNWMWS
jgi:hypothetical protein